MKPSLIFLFPLPFIHNLSQVPRLFPWEHFQLEFLCQAAEFNPGCTHQPTWEGAAFLCSHSTSVLHTTSRTTSSTAVFFMPFLAQPPLFNLTLSLSPLYPTTAPSPTISSQTWMGSMYFSHIHLANMYQRTDNIRLAFWKNTLATVWNCPGVGVTRDPTGVVCWELVK